MLDDGNLGEKIQSLARIIMEYINSQDEPLDEDRLERIIRDAEDRIVQEDDTSVSEPVCNVSPSVRNPVSAPITTEEAKDFLRIDLNLLAKKDYFDRFFG